MEEKITAEKKPFRELAVRFGVSLVAPLLVGIIGSALTIWATMHTLDLRVTNLENKLQIQEPLAARLAQLETTIERHEKALDRDFMRHEQIVAALTNKTEDQERRLTLLEAHFGETQSLIVEIRSDIKTLLTGRPRH